MSFWVPACAGMMERELRVGGYLVRECRYRCWHALRGVVLVALLSRGGGSLALPRATAMQSLRNKDKG